MILIKLYLMHQKNLRRRNNLVGFRQTYITKRPPFAGGQDLTLYPQKNMAKI